jgi:hypothetical protein
MKIKNILNFVLNLLIVISSFEGVIATEVDNSSEENLSLIDPYPYLEIHEPSINGLNVEQNGVTFPTVGDIDGYWCKNINPNADGNGPFEFNWGDGTKSCSWFPAKHNYYGSGKFHIEVRVKNTEGFISARSNEIKISTEKETIKVYLNEEFKLKQEQTAKVVNYKDMKIKLNEIMIVCPTCSTTNSDYAPSCGGECRPIQVNVQVEMPSNCKEEYSIDGCTSAGTEFNLNVGESKEIFGTELTLLKLREDSAKFIVKKPNYHYDVGVNIEPKDQTISYGDYAKYKVIITDKHAIPTCLDKMVCEHPAPYEYEIDVSYLPFIKEFPKQITLQPGQEKAFTLTVKTDYVTKKIHTKEIDETNEELVVQYYEMEEKPAVEKENTKIYPQKQYKFSVGATLVGDHNVRG